MKVFRFDAFEFDPPDSEQEVEVVVSTPTDPRHDTLAKFADDVCGAGIGRRLAAPAPFFSLLTFKDDKVYLSQVAGLDVAENCPWLCFVVSDEWNCRQFLLDAGNAFVSFRWSTTA